MKRVLSLLLCAVLLCSVLPVHVSAGDPDPLTVKIGMWRVTDYNGVFATSIRTFTGESLAGTLIDDENTNLLVAWDAESATIYVEKNPDCKFHTETVSSIYVSGGQDYDCINVRLGEDVYLDVVGANETETTLCPSLKIIGSGKLGSVDMLYHGNPTAYKGTDRGNIILADSVALSFEKYYRDLQNGWEVLLNSPNRILVQDDASVDVDVHLNLSGALSYRFFALKAAYGVEIDTWGSIRIRMDDAFMSNWNGLTGEIRESCGISCDYGSIEIRNLDELEITYPVLHVSKRYAEQRLGGCAMDGKEIVYDPDAFFWDDSDPERLYAYSQAVIRLVDAPGVYFLPCEGSAREDGVYPEKAGRDFSFLAVFRSGYRGGDGFRVMLDGKTELETLGNGVYRIVKPAPGKYEVAAEGVELNKPFTRSPSNCVLYSKGDTVGVPLSFTLRNPDYLKNLKSGPVSVKLECPEDASFSPVEIDCGGMDELGRVDAYASIPWSPGMKKTMRLSLTWGAKTYYSASFTVSGTSDPDKASNRYPAAVSVCTADGVWHELARGKSEDFAKYTADGVLQVTGDICAVREEGSYFGTLTLQCASGVSIANDNRVSGTGTAVDVSGDLVVMANNCTISSFIPDGSDAAVGIRSGAGSVSVSGSGALNVRANSDPKGSNGKATGIEAADGRIVIDVLNAANANIRFDLKGSEIEPFAADDGAELLDCNALIIAYNWQTDVRAKVDVSQTGQYSYNLCRDADSKVPVEIYDVGCSRTLTLKDGGGGENDSYIALKYGDRTYVCGAAAQVAYNALVYVEVSDPKKYYEMERVTGVYCAALQETGNGPEGYTEYSTRVTGEGVVEIIRRQTLIREFRCQGRGDGSGVLLWSLSEPSASPQQCRIEVAYADGSKKTYTLTASEFQSGEFALTGRPVSAQLVAVFVTVGVVTPWIDVDLSFYVDYTDAENRFNADACIPAGDVGTVAEMDFSRFVHGGSGVYRYWLSISDAENSGYTYSFNETSGLLRLTRDYPRAASLKNSAGWYNCHVEIYDEKTGCGAILYFTVGAFSENPDTVPYPVYVNGLQVLSNNAGDVLGDGTVRYAPAAGDAPAVLTLTDANLTVAWNGSVTGDDGGFFGCIVAFEPLDIVIEGNCGISLSEENYVSGRGAYDLEFVEGEQFAGIVAGLSGNYFTLRGDGDLSIDGARAFSSWETCFIDGPEIFCSTAYGVPDGTNVCFVSGTVFSMTDDADCIYSNDPLNMCMFSASAGPHEIWLLDEDTDGSILGYRPVSDAYYHDGFRDEHKDYSYPRAVFITDRGLTGKADGGIVTAEVCGGRGGKGIVAAAQYVGGQMKALRMDEEPIDLALGGTARFRFAPAEGAEYRLFLLSEGTYMPLSPAWSSR